MLERPLKPFSLSKLFLQWLYFPKEEKVRCGNYGKVFIFLHLLPLVPVSIFLVSTLSVGLCAHEAQVYSAIRF